MENQRLFPNLSPELNSSDHPPPCFLKLNWDQSMDLTAQFESALSLLVSSPSSNSPPDSLVIRELIGRLRSICFSSDTSPPSSYHSSSYRPPRSSTPDNGEFGNHRKESSPSDWSSTCRETRLRSSGESSARKRKADPKDKGKAVASSSASTNPPKILEEGNLNAKRCRSSKAEQIEGAHINGETNSKPSEPSEDYIHVRARRGEATDSHSLAERARREKIGERMKFLQDLVPGCEKVTGKAVMLDEIINYVQSLQRQIEFLSMKLASIDPWIDIDMENLILNEMNLQGIVCDGFETSYPMNPIDSGLLQGTLSMQLPEIDDFGDASSQLGTFLEDDFQSGAHIDFGRNQ